MKRALCVFAVLCALWASALAASKSPLVTTAQIYPLGKTDFGFVTVGKTSSIPQTISVYNESAVTVTVNSVTITQPVFTLISGTLPMTLPPGAIGNFVVTFTPTAAQQYKATMTFAMTGSPTLKCSLTGKGASTTAVNSLSVSSMNFPNQALGTMSAAQKVTITNRGTTAFSITGVNITAPFVEVGFTGAPIKVPPRSTATISVTYAPSLLGPVYGNLLISYDVLPNSGVALSGSAVAATSLGINNYPILPTAVQNAAYQANLTAVGGVGALTWSLPSGSSLPSGLTLQSTGTITGTLGSVAVGNYSVTLQAADSNVPPSTATAVFTLPVVAPTGAHCSNIQWDATGTSSPLVPLMDLGTGYYQDQYGNQYQGGLYANGVNSDDPDHQSYGNGLAAGIQPLDANGNPDSNGKYVMITVGHSNTYDMSQEMMTLSNVDPSKNSHFLIVSGATGDAGGSYLADPNNYFWAVMTNNYLPDAGVTPNQVVAAWVNEVDAEGNPPKIQSLRSELDSISQNLLIKFPNIKIAYFTSVNYTAYSNGVVQEYVEPYAYEAGFATKLAIQDQLSGLASLNFNPALGPVLAPWMAWGPYYWTNGLLGRSDGLWWACNDNLSDGTHPGPPGTLKGAAQVLNFLKTDSTASPWYFAPGYAHK